jgi:hypothetical protein
MTRIVKATAAVALPLVLVTAARSRGPRSSMAAISRPAAGVSKPSPAARGALRGRRGTDGQSIVGPQGPAGLPGEDCAQGPLAPTARTGATASALAPVVTASPSRTRPRYARRDRSGRPSRAPRRAGRYGRNRRHATRRLGGTASAERARATPGRRATRARPARRDRPARSARSRACKRRADDPERRDRPRRRRAAPRIARDGRRVRHHARVGPTALLSDCTESDAGRTVQVDKSQGGARPRCAPSRSALPDLPRRGERGPPVGQWRRRPAAVARRATDDAPSAAPVRPQAGPRALHAHLAGCQRRPG